MDEKQAKELVGKPILISFSTHKGANVYGARITQLSPSGTFIQLKIEKGEPYWTNMERIHIVEELTEPSPSPPPSPPPPPRLTIEKTPKSFLEYFGLGKRFLIHKSKKKQ